MTLPVLWHRDDWNEIVVTPLQTGEGWVMRASYRVQYETNDGVNHFLTVPKGFITDLASIPGGLPRALFRTWGKHTAAAICHDVLYRYGAGKKSDADDLFEALMLADGVDPDDASTMATATRIFGDGLFDSPAPDVQIVLGEDGYFVDYLEQKA